MQVSQTDGNHSLIKAIFLYIGIFLRAGLHVRPSTETLFPLGEETTAFPLPILFLNGCSQFNDIPVGAASTIALKRPQRPGSGSAASSLQG